MKISSKKILMVSFLMKQFRGMVFIETNNNKRANFLKGFEKALF
jgi:hypothetical protein